MLKDKLLNFEHYKLYEDIYKVPSEEELQSITPKLKEMMDSTFVKYTLCEDLEKSLIILSTAKKMKEFIDNLANNEKEDITVWLNLHFKF